MYRDPLAGPIRHLVSRASQLGTIHWWRDKRNTWPHTVDWLAGITPVCLESGCMSHSCVESHRRVATTSEFDVLGYVVAAVRVLLLLQRLGCSYFLCLLCQTIIVNLLIVYCSMLSYAQWMCVCVCLFVCLYVYTNTHTQTYITHTRTHARTHTRTHARTHARTHTRKHARTHAHTHTHTILPWCSQSRLLGPREPTQSDSSNRHVHLGARPTSSLRPLTS